MWALALTSLSIEDLSTGAGLVGTHALTSVPVQLLSSGAPIDSAPFTATSALIEKVATATGARPAVAICGGFCNLWDIDGPLTPLFSKYYRTALDCIVSTLCFWVLQANIVDA